jgi:hypothetical protein
MLIPHGGESVHFLRVTVGGKAAANAPCFENSRVDPLTRLAEFTLSPFAALRAVRSGRANRLPTLSPKRGRGYGQVVSCRAPN